MEHTNEMLIGGAKLKLQEFRKAVADIKRKYPQIINDVDEKEIEQLVEAAQEAIITRVRDKRGLKRRDSDADKMSGDHGRGRLIRF